MQNCDSDFDSSLILAKKIVISILKIVTALGWFLFVILHHCRICACTVEQDDEDDEFVIHMRRKVNIVFIS